MNLPLVCHFLNGHQMAEEIVLRFRDASAAVPRSVVGELRKLPRDASLEYRLDESSDQQDQELLSTIDAAAFTAFAGVLVSDCKWDFQITLLNQVLELARIWDCPRVEKAGEMIRSGLAKSYRALLLLLDCQRRKVQGGREFDGAINEIARELSAVMQHPEFVQVSPENFRKIWGSPGRREPNLEALVRYLAKTNDKLGSTDGEFLRASDIEKLSAADVRALSQANFKFSEDVLRRAAPIDKLAPSGNSANDSDNRERLHAKLQTKIGFLNQLESWLVEQRDGVWTKLKEKVKFMRKKLDEDEEEEDEEEEEEDGQP